MPRPPFAGPPPVWASNANYGAGAFSWSGTPVKVAPGSGPIAAGYTPNVPPGAQTDNYYLNMLSRFAAHADAIEVQNWGPLLVAETVLMDLDVLSTTPVCWDSFSRNLWMVGGHGVMRIIHSENGVNWTNTGVASTSGHIASVAAEPTGYLVAANESAGKLHRRAPSAQMQTWTDYTIAGAAKFNGILWDSYESRWVAWGRDTVGAGNARLWTNIKDLSIGFGTPTIDGLTGGGGDQMYWVACGPGRTVAIGKNGGVLQLWTSSSVQLEFTNRGNCSTLFSGGIGVVCSLQYDATFDVFIVLTSTGKCYVSGDGISWVQQNAGDEAGSRIVQQNTLACLGSIWAAVAMDATLPVTLVNQWRIVYSVDLGVTWSDVPYPFDQGTSPLALNVVDDRFCLLGTDGGSQTVAAFSMRLR